MHDHNTNTPAKENDKEKGACLIDYSGFLYYPGTLVYTVAAGDTLQGIAARFNTTTELLTKTNRGIDLNRLFFGQQIFIPIPNAGKSVLPVLEIAKKVGPCIVGIKVTINNSKGGLTGTEGSGVIIDKDGHIATNHHLVKDINQNGSNAILEVFLSDKRQAKAKLIGGDEIYDMAVVKIDLEKLPVAELGDSSKVEIGELAVAIGNPNGSESTGLITTGVISGVNRRRIFQESVLTYIQTDAAINRGNSGGALVNREGRVIGINSWGVSIEDSENMGFAIPINTAKPLLDQLIASGKVKNRLRLGITGKEITEAEAHSNKWPNGIHITDIDPEGSAAKAGIHKGDILISLADKPVNAMKDLDEIKKGYKAGDIVNLVIVRKKKIRNLRLTFSKNVSTLPD